MILRDREILITDIMLDILNPRFGRKKNISQEEIASELLRDKKSKELLASMNAGLSWVNKIVVVPIKELSPEEKKEYGIYGSKFKYKYIVIEGNTRLACLLHPSITQLIPLNKTIPMLVTLREKNESFKEFLKARKRLQSISNVMIVKDWGDVQKAKQLYDSYILNKEINNKSTENAIFKALADDIGLSIQSVKKNIYRYIFFKEINDNSEQISENDFKYLEISEVSNNTRSLFGYDTPKGVFLWNESEAMDDESRIEEIEKKQELLYMVPQIINISKDEKINSKQLRDIITKYHQEDFVNVHRKMQDVIDYSKIDDYANDAFIRFFPKEEDSMHEELELGENIKTVMKILRKFPVNEDFSSKYKKDIESIKYLSEKILKFMDVTQ